MSNKKPEKPSRGQCGTCCWFEVWPGDPDPGQPIVGSCVVSPPQPYFQQMMKKPSAVVDPSKPQIPEFTSSVSGMVPPTNEFRKCSLWRPFGTQPPFDDSIRPGFKAKLTETMEEAEDATKQ